jgi:hypothetical protein
LLRRLALVVLAFALSASVSARPARAANDPKLLWKTIETAHFRINYYSTEDEVAKHLATLAEAIFARLVPAVGWPPGEITEIALTDQTDAANGSATALPFDAIRLNVTAPDDMSPLGDVDDWYLELLTHEYTHILHTDHIEGIPALINRILGKTFAPNQVQPHWLLEGLAVFEESTYTSGGRLRSSMWNMWMRADVLEDNLATLDVFSNSPRRWPQGNIWYLYGSFFMQWIAEQYGEQAIRAMIDDYAYQVIPYAVNRSIRRATGRTYEELYAAWVDSMKRNFGAQADAVRARGLREGIRLTHGGNTVEHPRWIPANAWPEHAGDLLFYQDEGHSRAGFWALPLVRDERGHVLGAREDKRDLMIRNDAVGSTSFMPDGGVAFSNGEIHDNVFLFDDLSELPAHEKSPNGMENRRVRWTDGWRAIDPSVSPDGRRVVFTTNHRGTTYLMMGDVAPSSKRADAHELKNVRPLVPSATFDQAFTPRWSPDNRHVAYSSWQRGGYRDVRIVDTNDGSYVEVTHDRAVDAGPCFSADGRWLYFSSDRTGIMNVYAFELATGRLRQVTNVLTGAYQPEPSPDGRSLAYVGYTHDGYDVFVIPVDETQWLDALPYLDTRPAPPAEPPPIAVKSTAYNPLLTLQPRAYTVQSTPGNYGQATIVSATGSDIAGIHNFTGSITTEWEHPDLQFSFSYGYTKLPFDLNMGIYRTISPANDYSVGGTTITYAREAFGVSSGIGYSAPATGFEATQFALSYSMTRVGAQLPLPVADIDPYGTTTLPTLGMLGSMHIGFLYSNSEGYLWSVGNETGFSVGASIDVSHPYLASDFVGYASSAGFATYFKMPWLQHHALALHVSGGSSGGNFGGRGAFYVGGYQDLPIIDVVRNDLTQGSILLRGYPPVAEVGHYYGLFNAEYRFPILNVDRGLSTLPFFVNRVSGSTFLDYGSAFDDPNDTHFKTGVGAELWFDLTLGYVLGFTFRAGYESGLASGGMNKAYFVTAVPF